MKYRSETRSQICLFIIVIFLLGLLSQNKISNLSLKKNKNIKSAPTNENNNQQNPIKFTRSNNMQSNNNLANQDQDQNQDSDSDSNDYLPYSEIEDQMIQFMSKLRKIQTSQDKTILKNGKHLKKIKIMNVEDLSQALAPYFRLYHKIKSRKTEELENLNNRLKHYEDSVRTTSEQMKLIQAKYETVIAQSQLAGKELADKKNKEIEVSNDLDNVKQNFESENEKFISLLKNSQFKRDMELLEVSMKTQGGDIIRTITSDSEKNKDKKQERLSNESINPLRNYNNWLKKLYTDLNTRRDNVNSVISLKKQVAKEEAALDHFKDVFKSSSYDAKLFSLITKNIEDNTRKFREEIDAKLISLAKLKKSLDNRTSGVALTAEKANANETLNSSRATATELLDSIKRINEETEALLKKKTEFKEKYQSLSVKKELKMRELEKRIGELEEVINSGEVKKNLLMKKESEFLVEEFQKIKNLVLVLNKLLINFKEQQKKIGSNFTKNSALLNNLLFDNNIIDLQDGVKASLLDEVTNSIINIK